MTENLQENLHQDERKLSKGGKICVDIRWELDCEKCSKTFYKVFDRQNIPVTRRAFLNQLKNFYKNSRLNRTPLKLPYLSEVLTKIPKKKKTSKLPIARKISKYGVFCGPYFPVFGSEKTPYLDTFCAVFNFCKDSLEVHNM